MLTLERLAESSHQIHQRQLRNLRTKFQHPSSIQKGDIHETISKNEKTYQKTFFQRVVEGTMKLKIQNSTKDTFGAPKVNFTYQTSTPQINSEGRYAWYKIEKTNLTRQKKITFLKLLGRLGREGRNEVVNPKFLQSRSKHLLNLHAKFNPLLRTLW